ncbi:MAG: alginate lyase family protein [Tepidisphaeraceae bacterium]
MPRPPFQRRFDLQHLEGRVLLSGAPAQVAAPISIAPIVIQAPLIPATHTPASLVTQAVREQLVSRLTDPLQTQLAPLTDNAAAFDQALLDYMKANTTSRFFFGPGNIAGYVDFIDDYNLQGGAITLADQLLLHDFPQQGDSATYTVPVPDVIDWDTDYYPQNVEFLPNLNRFDFWTNLGQAYQFTGDTDYVKEIVNQLASWSAQTPTTNPAKWGATGGVGWNLLNASLRAEAWLWSYQMVLSSSSWTKEANTLFVSRMWEHGDFLARAGEYEYTSNRSLFHAKSQLLIAQVFPEFLGAGTWETAARTRMFNAMDAQLYNDGSHLEQSPGYTANVVEDLLEAKWLDEINGDLAQWPGLKIAKLTNAVESYRQFLAPDATRPAIGDTYRTTSVTMFLKANLVQNTSAFPAAKPRTRDVWLFGGDAVDPFMGNPVIPSLGSRGKTKALTDSGNYIARSGNDSNDRQLTFDAGPTGGGHGHFDLLNFELYGGGRPLISDPGAYIYGNSAERQYVVSTRAHNTISVAGANHAALEGATNPGFVVDQYTETGSSMHITAHHHGYQQLAGRPVVGRSMWYDLDGTILIVDWGEANQSQTYTQSFNLQTENDPNTSHHPTGVQGDGSFKTRFQDGGNVRIAPVSRPGQTVVRGGLTFVTNDSSGGDYQDDAYRFTVTQSGTFVYFVTLITAYDGLTAPNTTASLLTTNATAGQTIQVQLTKDGEAPQTIDFVPPQLERPTANLGDDAGSSNDVAYDSTGRLHMVFFDRADRDLKYAVQETNGLWSILETIDNGTDAGVYVSLALDSNNLPGVAYFDGDGGDLEYAKYIGGAWQKQTVDAVGSVGLYPSLAFSRSNGPAISYYHRTKGDLRLATTTTDGWLITTIDSAGDVGRATSMTLDPNRPEASKFAIAYEDTSNANMKYAIQGTFAGAQTVNAGYSIYLVDDMLNAGGYVSFAFYDSGSNDAKRYKPSMTYYNAYNSSLTYAYSPDGTTWEKQTIAGAGASKEGLYTTLLYDNTGKANIFFFDKTNNLAKRARKSGASWSITTLVTGGREMQVAKKSTGALAYTTLDDLIPRLDVRYLGS